MKQICMLQTIVMVGQYVPQRQGLQNVQLYAEWGSGGGRRRLALKKGKMQERRNISKGGTDYVMEIPATDLLHFFNLQL